MKSYTINKVDGSPSKVNIYNFLGSDIVNKAHTFDNESKKSFVMVNEFGTNVDVFKGDIVKFDFLLNLNEELDNANVSVNTKENYGTIFASMSKCLVFFDVHNNVTNIDFDITSTTFKNKYFKEDGYTPKMHAQYILIKPVMQTLTEKDFFHAFNLVEPTYLLRFAYTGTNSDTNLPEINVYDPVDKVVKTYKQPENNCLSILERQLALTGIETKGRHESWYYRIYIPEKIKKLLRNAGKGSSLVFNCATLYDTVFKIGKYIKRYPVLRFNPNYKPNQIITPEDEREFILDYVTYDGSDKNIIKLSNIIGDITQCTITNGSEKQANNIVCENQNLVSTNSVFYPSKYDFAAISGNENDMLLKGSERNNYTFKLPFIIEDVINVKCYKAGKYSGNYNSFPFTFHSSLSSIPCVSYSEWISINDENVRNNTLYFQENSNEIIVSHFVEHAFPNDKYLNGKEAFIGFQVEYIPQINAMTSNGTGNFKEMINQIDSKLDSKLFGSWIENYQKQNQSVSMGFKKTIFKLEDLVESGTIVEDDENKQWIINLIQVNSFNNHYCIDYMLSYQIPKRSEVVTASQRIQNKVIESNKSYDRLINVKENVYIDFDYVAPTANKYSGNYFKSSKYFFSNFLNQAIDPIELGYLKIYHASTSQYKYFKLPLIKSIFGNSILLSIKFTDRKYIGVPNGLINVSDESEKEANFIVYADSFNKIESLSIVFANGDGNIRNDFIYNNVLYESSSSSGIDLVYENHKYVLKDFNEKYPESTIEEYTSKYNIESFPKIEDLMIFKDTYEVPTITCQLEFINNDNKVILYDDFIELMPVNIIKTDVKLGIYFHENLEEDINPNSVSLVDRIEDYISQNNSIALCFNKNFIALKRYVTLVEIIDNEENQIYNKLITRRLDSCMNTFNKLYISAITK